MIHALSLVLAFGYPFLPKGMEHQTLFFVSPNVMVTQKFCPKTEDVPAPKSCKVIAGVPQCAPGATETDDLQIICLQKTSVRRCNFSKSFKRALMDAYSLKVMGEADHRIPLELGGSNDIKNVWPQGLNFKTKDRVEGELHRAVCSNCHDKDHCAPGKLSLEAARTLILNSWEQVAKAPPIHETRGNYRPQP